MNSDLEIAKKILQNENYTCVLVKGKSIYKSVERGVIPLLKWFDSSVNLKDYSAADKVVGKAVAYIYILLGVREVYAHIISRPSFYLLKKYGIKVFYNKMVEEISNRAGTGQCPMEQATMDIEEPYKALMAIRDMREHIF